MSHNSSHLRTNSINFSSISEDKNRQHSLQANTRSVVGGDVGLFTLSELSRYRQVLTRSVTSNFLAQRRRRNGTETWRRRSCLCEHLCLITYEKILLNGDVPWRNGNATYSVNRPLNFVTCAISGSTGTELGRVPFVLLQTASWQNVRYVGRAKRKVNRTEMSLTKQTLNKKNPNWLEGNGRKSSPIRSKRTERTETY